MTRAHLSLEQPFVCSRCKSPTTNPACLSCNHHRCEPCFQFAQACCTSMKMPDGCVPDMKRETTTNSNALVVLLLCSNSKCGRATYISTVQYPIVSKRPYKFCPVCGSEATVEPYRRERVWQHVASRYNLPAEVVKMLYDNWTRELPQVSFRKYIRGVFLS